jgi:hypothetical protein
MVLKKRADVSLPPTQRAQVAVAGHFPSFPVLLTARVIHLSSQPFTSLPFTIPSLILITHPPRAVLHPSRRHCTESGPTRPRHQPPNSVTRCCSGPSATCPPHPHHLSPRTRNGTGRSGTCYKCAPNPSLPPPPRITRLNPAQQEEDHHLSYNCRSAAQALSSPAAPALDASYAASPGSPIRTMTGQGVRVLHSPSQLLDTPAVHVRQQCNGVPPLTAACSRPAPP